MNAAEFADRHHAVKTATGWKACCPAHDDEHPSLDIAEGEDGRVLVKCWAGCPTEAVVAAAGLKMSDLFPDKPRHNGTPPRKTPTAKAPAAKEGKQLKLHANYESAIRAALYGLKQSTGDDYTAVAKWLYQNRDGTECAYVIRFEPPEGAEFKTFKPMRSEPDGWRLCDPDTTWPIYHLPEILKAEGTIFVCEGEKAADVARAIGILSTCSAHGAQAAAKTDWTPLAGREVVILPDFDPAGEDYARDVAAILTRLTPPATVKIVRLPGLPEAGDIVEFIEAHDTQTSEEVLAEIQALATASPLWAAPAVEAPEAAAPAIQGRPLSVLVRHNGDDPDELLLFRFLCRLGSLLICGPTGIGKSALALQFMILWALCRDAFGIKPARPLKSVLVQAENDDGDLAEMRDGVIAGLNLTAAEAKQATENVIVWREDERTSVRFFCEVVRPLLEAHKPDLLWIDPALAYLGGEANSQKDVGGFLRNQLNPLLREFNCAAAVVHHVNKPPTGREKPDWKAGDFAYLGSGSAEWANWARAILALRSIGSHANFELQAAKRGGRLGWREADGQTKSYVKYLAHATEGKIYWKEVTAEEIEKGGRPKTADIEEFLGLLPPEGLTAGDWQQTALAECGIKEGTFHNYRRALRDAKRVVKSKITDKWQPYLKP